MKYIKIAIIPIMLLMIFQTAWTQECMEGASEEGVNIIGFVQTQSDYNFLGEDLRGESLNELNFYFNRVRIGVTGNAGYDFSYYAMTEMSPTSGGPMILDAFVSYNRFAPYVKASFGQFRTPFGLEVGSTGCHKLHTINRTHVVSNLAAPFRDFGLMISGGTGDISILGSKTTNFLGYKLALLNGTGLNTPDDNRKKDLLARVTLHPLDFITIGASYRTGEHPPLADGVFIDDKRTRFGLDVELKYADFIVQGEFIDGSDDGSYTIGGGCGDPLETVIGSINRKGFFGQILYMTPWNLQPVIKFEQYDPNTSEIEGLNDQINEITYGFNYFFNEWTRLQVNYLYRAEENARVEVPNDALLIQMQIVF